MASNKGVIGLLGGGQLGRMLCQAAGPLGHDIAILDEDKAPAKLVNAHPGHVAGSFKDADRVRELAARCDYLTVEIEHVDTDVLEDIDTNGVRVSNQDGTTRTHRPLIHPAWRTLRLIQDKFLQKEHFRNCATPIPIADQMAIAPDDGTRAALEEAGAKYGYPFMLKARKGSYDGRGNFKVGSEADLDAAVKALGTLPLYAEKWAPFVQELAVMVIRTEDDEGKLKRVVPYPAVETVHEDSICTKVFMPPRQVSKATCEKAQKLASDVVATLWGRGVFAVEMFLLEDGSLMVNEVAPRPHNSGHYTIEAVPYMSQYKAQLHAVLDLPVPQTLTPRVESAIMLNILGGATATSHDELVDLARNTFWPDTDVYLHLYGKESKPSRKIGHITLTSSAPVQTLEKQAAHFFDLVDKIRADRLAAATETLRPQAAKTAQPSPEKKPAASSSAPLVLVTMGSDSDLPKLEAGLKVLDEFEVPYTVRITSAHRTPKLMTKVAEEAAAKGIKIIVAAAGGAAHLPGMVSSETPLPVIGIPIAATHLDGQDSLLSIVQMPRGIPTLTVGINNSTNAALGAIQILGTFMPELQEKMVRYQKSMEEGVYKKDDQLVELGYKAYLNKIKS